MSEKDMQGEPRGGLSRRSFFKGSALLSATVLGGSALAACAPSAGGSDSTAGATEGSDLGEAAPIAPVDPPAEWSAEADIVVVGTGGGGLAATLLARDKGATVITIEKDQTPGGATKCAGGFASLPGGSTIQDEMGYAWPVYPYSRKELVNRLREQYQSSNDDRLVGTIADYSGIFLDWAVLEHEAPMVAVAGGSAFFPKTLAEGKVTSYMAVKEVTDYFYQQGQEAGADFHMGTRCENLVVDGGRVVGIKAKDGKTDEELYFKARKGVVLCAGGMGMNWDMLKEYIPTAYRHAVYGGPTPSHTGECIRMAVGAGADIAGWDSWNCWESAPDNGTREWQPFWGARTIFQVPWLNIDKRGERYNFYAMPQQPEVTFEVGRGDVAVAATQMSRIGGRGYAIFDADYEQYMFKMNVAPGAERRPWTKDDPIVEDAMFDKDFSVEFQKGVDAGLIKKADTLEELAEQLGLKPEVVTAAVDNWNELCEKGEDTELDVPYLPEWLTPVKTPPFYGGVIGGCIGKTHAGLRTDESLRVLNPEGEVIAGLFANFHTAGGLCGESSFGGSPHMPSGSFLGGNLLSWVSGYLAADTALAS